ncbi:MAG: translation initiation factor IF-3 [Candidatus Niyogibacteria bacterium]|nr:translation initiation factor IF-3 [Candidatus Niyogibacteria bacterium]
MTTPPVKIVRPASFYHKKCVHAIESRLVQERGTFLFRPIKTAIVNYLKKEARINQRITAPEVRLIGPEGNLGVVKTSEAQDMAKAAGLDLIEISPNATPPVAKIMDYGKYKYEEERKIKGTKKGHGGEVRTIRVGLGTSDHDLEMKAKQAATFLERGDRIKVDLFLRGRSKYLDKAFLRERLKRILIFIPIPHKIVEDGKWGPRGPYVLIEKA